MRKNPKIKKHVASLASAAPIFYDAAASAENSHLLTLAVGTYLLQGMFSDPVMSAEEVTIEDAPYRNSDIVEGSSWLDDQAFAKMADDLLDSASGMTSQNTQQALASATGAHQQSKIAAIPHSGSAPQFVAHDLIISPASHGEIPELSDPPPVQSLPEIDTHMDDISLLAHADTVQATQPDTSSGNSESSGGGTTTPSAPAGNTAPVIADVSVSQSENNVETFALSDFTSNFTDTDGESLASIKVMSLPANGVLELSGVAVVAGDVITAADIPNLTFTPDLNWTGTASFDWQASDGTDFSATEQVNISITNSPLTLVSAITDQNVAGNSAIGALSFDASTHFSDPDGGIAYSLTVTDYSGNAVAGFTIGAATGIITNTALIPNSSTAYIFTVTAIQGADTISQTFDYFTNAGALVAGSSTGDDTIAGTAAAERFFGDDGNDSITTGNGGDIAHGGAGDDTIGGGTGNDTLYGGQDDDQFNVSGNGGYDRYYGGTGTNVIVGSTGNDTIGMSGGFDTINNIASIDGGAGTNTLYLYGGWPSVYSYDFSNTTLSNIGLIQGNIGSSSDLISITGTSGNDSITINVTTGTGNIAATVHGGAGDDTITGSTERDVFYGEDGNDQFNVSGNGNYDIYYGGTGSDTILGSASNDTIELRSGFDATNSIELIDGGAGTNTLALYGNYPTVAIYDLSATTLTNISAIRIDIGASNNDRASLIATSADDSISVNATSVNGNAYTIIDAGSGNDTIIAGQEVDTLTGGAGNDSITGGAGNDVMTGGTGADTFVWTATTDAANTTTTDRVTDFNQGESDKLDLTGVEQTGIVWDDTAAFSASGYAQARYYQSGGNTYVEVDKDGNGASNMVIRLDGLVTLTANDIIGIGAAPTLTGTLSDQNVAGNTAIGGWNFATSGAFTGNGRYSMTVTNYLGSASALFSIDSITGAISNTSVITNSAGAYIFTVTKDFGGTAVTEAFDLFVNTTALVGAATTGDDTITGGAAAQQFFGNDGADSIDTGNGGDYAHGGDGNDTIQSGSGSDRLYGGQGDDMLIAVTGTDTIYGGDGDDTIIRGTAGNNTFAGNGGDDLFSISGSAGNDSYVGGTGNDTILGSGGNDTIGMTGISGIESIDGGAGTNVISLSTSGGAYDFSGTTITNATIVMTTWGQNVTGTANADDITLYNLTSGGATGTVSGGGGDDTIRINGNDSNQPYVIDGGSGNDIIQGGTGNDTLSLRSISNLESIDGGAGTNQINLSINGTAYDFSGTIITNATIVMTTYGQNVTGTANADDITLYSLTSGGSTGTVSGGGGDDTIRINGADTNQPYVINGGSGNDIIQGGIGNDTLSLRSISNLESIDGGAGTNQINLSVNSLAYDFSGTTLTNINNIQMNGSGQTVTGSTGADTITGSANADNILGSGGADSIFGGAGNDVMTGGTGADTFTWTATSQATNTTTTDRVTDFEVGVDKLDLETIFPYGIVWIDGNAFNSNPDDATFGQARQYQSGGNTYIELDSDGNGASNMVIRLDGALTLTDADVIGIGTPPSVAGTGIHDQNIAASTAIGGLSLDVSSAFNGSGYYRMTVKDYGGNTISGFTIDSLTGTITNSALIPNQNYGYIFTVTKYWSSFSASETFDLFTNAGSLTGTATTGDDTITGTGVAERFWGGDGSDSIVTGNGGDYAHGGENNDTIEGGTGNDTLFGGQGDDMFYVSGDGGYDRFVGGEGNDIVQGSAGNDTIGLQNGLQPLYSIESIDGGAGTNTLALLGGWAAANTYDLSTISVANIDLIRIDIGATNAYLASVTATSANDSISVNVTTVNNANSVTIHGGGGDDTITGGSSWDSLYGDGGDDLFIASGTTNYDYYSGGTGNDTIQGTAGNDAIGLKGGLTAASSIESIDGGGGTNTLVLLGNWAPVTYDLTATTLQNINSIRVDLDTGNKNAASVIGTTANDTITVNVITDAAANSATISGGDGADSLYGSSSDDSLMGDAGVDTLHGGGGDDTLYGGTGNDTIFGDSGADSMNGGAGDDTMIGWMGQDTFTGGTGVDYFKFIHTAESGSGSPDYITDFSQAEGDKIDLSQISSNILWLGTGNFDATGQQARYYQTATETFLEIDTNGDGNANLVMRLNGVINLTSADVLGSVPIDSGGSPTLTSVLTDQNTAAGGAIGSWVFDATTAFGGTGYYSLKVESYSGTPIAGFSIDSITGSITNTQVIPNSNTAYVFTVTKIDSGRYVTETFDLFTNTGTIFAGQTTGADTITGTAAAEQFFGDAGADSISTGDGGDLVHGGDGNDTIVGGTGNDTLYGGEGTDLFLISGGWDDYFGSDSNDTVLGTAASEVIGLSGGFSSVNGIETIDGAGGTDTISVYGDGGSYNLSSTTLVGNITHFIANVSTATLNSVTLTAAATADDIVVSANSTTDSVSASGGNGNDTFTGGIGFDTFSGGAGNDLMNVSGNAGYDSFNGGTGNDTLQGSGGNDTIGIRSGSGNTFSLANNSVELIDAGAGTNWIYLYGKDSGSNNYDFSGYTPGVNLLNITGFYIADGGTGLTTTLITTSGDDSITSDTTWRGDDITSIDAGAGNDTIVSTGVSTILGGAGDDSITAGARASSIDGGTGNDTIVGGTGADTITGGTGADHFVYNLVTESTPLSMDEITDFEVGVDKIDLSAINAAGISWLGTGAFNSNTYQARYYDDGSNTFVELDTDGDNVADLQIQLDGVLAPTLNDIIGAIPVPVLTDVAASLTVDLTPISVDGADNASTTDAVPVITGYAGANGTVIYSTEYNASWLAWKAFDGTANGWATSSGAVSNQYIGYDFTGTIAINKYSMTSRTDSANPSSPKDWTFQGYDGTQWVTLQTVTGQTGWAVGQTRTFTFVNGTEYGAYRLYVTANNGDSVIALSNLEMYAVNVGYTEPQILDSDVTITAGDNWNGGNVTFSFNGNGLAEDYLTIAAGNGITVSGTTVSYSGTAIGTITSDGTAGTDLIITLNTSATAVAVEHLIEQTEYFNSGTATQGNRDVSITTTSLSGTSTVQVITIDVPAPPALTGTLADTEVDGGVTAGNWSVDASTIYSGTGPYSLVVTDYTGATVGGFSIDTTTGMITNTSSIPNANAAYLFTVTRSGGSHTPTETFDLFYHSSTLTAGYTTGDDTITGTNGANVMWGDSGNDTIYGRGGNDTMHGGDGNDTIEGGSGNDLMYGGQGNGTFIVRNYPGSGSGSDSVGGFTSGEDTIQIASTLFDDTTDALSHVTYTGGNALVTLSSGSTMLLLNIAAGSLTAADFAIYDPTTGITTGSQTAGDDSITSNNSSSEIGGGAGNDTIVATGSGADALSGGSGNDSIAASTTDDLLRGGTGSDTISAGSGNDTITGGTGVDSLTGGSGSDVFVYSYTTDSGIGAGNRDIISDFVAGTDDVDLSFFTGTLTFRAGGLGTADFTGSVAQVAFQQSGGNTIVYVDTNGDNTTNFEIQLTGTIALTSSDFIL